MIPRIPAALLARVLVVVTTIGALVVLWLLVQQAEHRADVAEAAARTEHAMRLQAERQVMALKVAEAERTKDATAIDELRKDLNHALDNAPAGVAPAASTVAVGCARLRRQGDTGSAEYRRICG